MMPYLKVADSTIGNSNLHTGIDITPYNVDSRTASLHDQVLQLAHPQVSYATKLPGNLDLDMKAILSSKGKIDTIASIGSKGIADTGLSAKLLHDMRHIGNNSILTTNALKVALANLTASASNTSVNGDIVNRDRNIGYASDGYSAKVGKDSNREYASLGYKGSNGLSGYLSGAKPIHGNGFNTRFGVTYKF